MAISPGQMRAARGLLNWSQSDLGQKCNLSTTSIGAIEKGETRARPNNIAAIQKAFEDGGLEFLPDDGIRKRNAQLTVLTGREGLQEFAQEIVNTYIEDKREILQAYVDDKQFAQHIDDKIALDHIIKIGKAFDTKSRFKILQRQGDNYFPAKTYAEYKWVDVDNFLAVPFYVYGDCMALMMLNPEPMVIIHRHGAIAAAFRKQFDLIWKSSKNPPQELIDQWEIPERYLRYLKG